MSLIDNVSTLEIVCRSCSNFESMVQLRRGALLRSVDEHKWFYNKAIPHEIPLAIAVEDYERQFGEGWNEGFLGAYCTHGCPERSPEVPEIKVNSQHSCINREYIALQYKALVDFIERRRQQTEEKTGKEISFDDINHLMLTNEKFVMGWGAGYKVGYCGLSCKNRTNCTTAQNYLVE